MLPYKSSYRDTATVLVNQIFLALGWKNVVTQTQVCFALLCSHPLLRALSSFTSCNLASLKQKEQKLSKEGKFHSSAGSSGCGVMAFLLERRLGDQQTHLWCVITANTGVILLHTDWSPTSPLFVAGIARKRDLGCACL